MTITGYLSLVSFLGVAAFSISSNYKDKTKVNTPPITLQSTTQSTSITPSQMPTTSMTGDQSNTLLCQKLYAKYDANISAQHILVQKQLTILKSSVDMSSNEFDLANKKFESELNAYSSWRQTASLDLMSKNCWKQQLYILNRNDNK